MRRLRRILAVAAAAFLATGTLLPAADAVTQGGLGIRLLDAPVALKNDPRAHVYIVDVVKPGEKFTRHIEVTNNTGSAQAIDMYPAAATINNGSWTVQPGRAANDLTSWISMSPSVLQLANNASATVTATFAVPTDVTNGERYAALIASTRPQAKPGSTVAVVSRIGIRVYLAVDGSGVPKSDFTVDTLTAGRGDDGAPYVQAMVHNTGGRALDMTGSLKLDHGPGGLSAGPFPAKLGTTLAPGQTEPVTVPLDKALPAGPWHARIDLQSGLLKRAAEGTITFPAGDGTKAAPVKAKSISLAKNRNFLVPLAILLLLGIAIGIFFLLWKRRKRKEEEEEEPGRVGATR